MALISPGFFCISSLAEGTNLLVSCHGEKKSFLSEIHEDTAKKRKGNKLFYLVNWLEVGCPRPMNLFTKVKRF